MTVTYIDSSAILRQVAREGDFRAVDQALASGAISSVLTRLEVLAAIYKRCHDGEMSVSDRDAMLGIAETATFPALDFSDLDATVFLEAQRLVVTYPLRPLDALHVATAAIADADLRRHGVELHFCTPDRRQANAAKAIFGDARVIFVPPWRGPHAVAPP